jgi:hypothetical protein
MKTLPWLLITAAMIGGSLVIYDQLRGDTPQATYHAADADSAALADLRARVARLEGSAGDQPMLRAGGAEALARRVDALERRMAGGPPPAPPPAAGSDGTAPGAPGAAAPAGPDGTTPAADDAPPSEQELAWFKRLNDAYQQERRDQRERDDLAARCKRLDISLTPEQSDKVIAARREMGRKMMEMYRSLPRDPNMDRQQRRQEMGAKREAIQQEFSVTLNKFLPAADASKLVDDLTARRGFRFGGMRAAPPAPRGR